MDHLATLFMRFADGILCRDQSGLHITQNAFDLAKEKFLYASTLEDVAMKVKRAGSAKVNQELLESRWRSINSLMLTQRQAVTPSPKNAISLKRLFLSFR
jgi:hypothetical protein